MPWEREIDVCRAVARRASDLNFDGGSSIHGGNAVICAPLLEAELRSFVRPVP